MRALLFAAAMLSPSAALSQCNTYGLALTEFVTRTQDPSDSSSFGLAAVRISALIYVPYPGPTCITDALVGFGTAHAAWVRPMEAEGTVTVSEGSVFGQSSLAAPEPYVRIGELYQSSGFRDVLRVDGTSEGTVTMTGHLAEGYYSSPVQVWLRRAENFILEEPIYFDRGGSFSVSVTAAPGERLQLVLFQQDQFIGVTPGLADEASVQIAYGVDRITVSDGLVLDSSSGHLVLREGVYVYTQAAPVPEPPSHRLLLAGLGMLAIVARLRYSHANLRLERASEFREPGGHRPLLTQCSLLDRWAKVIARMMVTGPSRVNWRHADEVPSMARKRRRCDS